MQWGRFRGTATAARAVALAVVVASVGAGAAACAKKRPADVVVGVPSTTSEAPGPTVVSDPGGGPGGGGKAKAGRDPRLLYDADGRPYGSPLVFRSDVPVPKDLVFVLVVGSDARPGQNMRKANADSLHLLAVNPKTLQGTILGIPRDAWVEIPGRGNGKVNSALPMGGPELLARTVRHLTGLPVHYWVLTGFTGLTKMVDELGGVDVFVDHRMNDRDSGAHFQPGWHHFDGTKALAFSRARHTEPNGDFDRSRNQGTLLLAVLAKMRAEVSDDAGLQRWLDVLTRHSDLDAPLSTLLPLGALARRLDPAAVTNVVVPGRVGHAGGQSVVFFGKDAADLFLDLRPDGVVGPARTDGTTTTSTTTTSTSTPAPSTSTTSTTVKRSTTSTTLR